jgi:hypothetical protein
MTQLVIRTTADTINQIERLQKKFGAPSRSDVIRKAIDLSDAISAAFIKGDKIIIEGHGQRREILIPGITNER